MCAQSVIYNIFGKQPDDWFNQSRIDLFYRMIEDAKTFDTESDQLDCTDPEKAKLLEKMQELQAKLNKG